MRFNSADWLRKEADEIVAVFGEAKLVRRSDGKAELRGGSDQDRLQAREWISLFWHEAVPERR